MNIAHPFRDGNGRSMRIWLDLMFKKEIQQVVDVKGIDHSYYYEGYNIYKVEELQKSTFNWAGGMLAHLFCNILKREG